MIGCRLRAVSRWGVALGVAALVAVVAVGCTGGRDLPGGASGGTGGAGGAGGSGPVAICDKNAGDPPVGAECFTGRSHPVCDLDGIAGTADDDPCWLPCGPNKSGTRKCPCAQGRWSCGDCNYDLSDARKYDCFQTAGAVACPPSPNDPTGFLLPISGDACTLPPCQPCGDAVALSFRLSTNAPSPGWCVCVPAADGSGSVYSCATVVDWAPQCQ